MSTATSLPGDNASRIAEQVDALGHEAAESLHSAASSIRERVQRGAKAVEDLAQSAAARLDEAGYCIEEHDLKHTIRGSRRLVRRYPFESLVFAAGAGLLTGFALRRLTHVCARTVGLGANRT